ALAARDGGILREMGMAIDQPRENRDRPAIDPSDGLGPLHSAQVVVVTHFGDPSVLDDERSGGVPAQRAKLRRIDEKTADAEQITLLVHRTPSMKTSQGEGTGNPAVAGR